MVEEISKYKCFEISSRSFVLHYCHTEPQMIRTSRDYFSRANGQTAIPPSITLTQV
jgi:hypothetical protein